MATGSVVEASCLPTNNEAGPRSHRLLVPNGAVMTSAVLSSAIAVPLIGFLLFVKAPLVLPSISVVALASAAIVALAAWCTSADRNSAGISLWDVSGAYAFIGFAAGMLSDPQQVVEFLSRSQPNSRVGSIRALALHPHPISSPTSLSAIGTGLCDHASNLVPARSRRCFKSS